jgi:hypothetical protein
MERGVRLLPMWLIGDTSIGERCQVITHVAHTGYNLSPIKVSPISHMGYNLTPLPIKVIPYQPHGL